MTRMLDGKPIIICLYSWLILGIYSNFDWVFVKSPINNTVMFCLLSLKATHDKFRMLKSVQRTHSLIN